MGMAQQTCPICGNEMVEVALIKDGEKVGTDTDCRWSWAEWHHGLKVVKEEITHN